MFSKLIFLFSIFYVVESASILALFSSLSFADHLVFRGYVASLARKGHSIVVMTPYPGQFQLPEAEKIVELDVGEASAQFWEEYRRLFTNTEDYYHRMRAINEFQLKLAITQLRSKQMAALFMNPNAKFDLVITEAEIPLLYAVAEKYKAPHIAITPSSGTVTMHESKGNPNHPLWYLDVNTIHYGRNLSYWEKAIEMNRYLQSRREYYGNYIRLSQLAAEKLFDLKRDLLQVEYDIDMLFLSANPILTGNRPTVPATVYVDRLQIKPGFPLHKDFLAVLEKNEKGVVYFSLGALQEPEQLSRDNLNMLTEAFREMPFTVLWKMANASIIDNIPPNVVIRPWFPQQEVLSHPNVKAFITHGGPRSLEEAVFYGVPIVGFPLQKPRRFFISEITKFGAGEILCPHYLTKQKIVDAVTKVATDEKYKLSMRTVKLLTEDARLSGPEQAVWWTEYVIRHKGAKHFRARSVGITFYEYLMVDVLLFMVALYSTVACVVYFLMKKLTRRLMAAILNRYYSIRGWRMGMDSDGGKFKSL